MINGTGKVSPSLSGMRSLLFTSGLQLTFCITEELKTIRYSQLTSPILTCTKFPLPSWGTVKVQSYVI